MSTITFTHSVISALKPEQKRREFWDKALPGFGIRVAPTGRKTWVLMYRIKGRKRRLTLGTFPAKALADARDEARVLVGKIQSDFDPAAKKQADRIAETVSELADEYVERHAKRKKKSWRRDQLILKKDVCSRIGPMKAKDVKRVDIIKILDLIVRRGAPIQANRTLEIVRKMFNFAIEQDLIETSPCFRISKPSKENRADKVLSAEEIEQLWKVLMVDCSDVSAAFKLRLVTAQRGAEVISMKWADIDFNTRWWTIPADVAKNGLTHRVPLTNLAIQILEESRLKGKNCIWVFPSPKDSTKPIRWTSKAARRIAKKSRILFVPHDLRRTAASHMTSLGVSRLVVSKILNHMESSVTAVYDRHSYDAEKREALERWSRRLEEIVLGPTKETIYSELALSLA